MKTAYLTDSFSTLGGLGSVAYGDPEYFREVQNQVYEQSPTRFADIHRPSDIFGALLALEEGKFIQLIKKTLKEEYASEGDFTDYIDVKYGAEWEDKIPGLLYKELMRAMDSGSEYGADFSDYFEKAIRPLLSGFTDSRELALKLVSELDSNPLSPMQTSLASRIVSNNPQTKLSTPPPDTKIALKNSIDLGLDYRGVSFATGYSTLEDYWGGVPYPGVTATNLIPSTLRESILDGYVGYASQIPLELAYNPIGADSIGNFNLKSPQALNFSDPLRGGSVLAQLPIEQQGDADIYAISLIGELRNGYTTFDPGTMSNGDAIDSSLIPNFEEQNADPDGGLPGLARSFGSPF